MCRFFGVQNAIFYTFSSTQNAIMCRFLVVQNAIFYIFSSVQNAIMCRFWAVQNAISCTLRKAERYCGGH